MKPKVPNPLRLLTSSFLLHHAQEDVLQSLAAFFMLVNASMLVAWRQRLTGQRAVQWQPTVR